jgi:hypothetical protein
MDEEFRLTSETLADADLPTATDPKLRLLGEIWSPPEAATLTEDPPQPEKARLSEGNNSSRAHRRVLRAGFATKPRPSRLPFSRERPCAEG